MSPYSNDYGQLSQALSREQIEEQEALNVRAQFMSKSNAMCHTELLDVQLREMQKARAASSDVAKPEAQHFDTEAHRAFMRGLG